ncbi:phosphomannomutase/phosphoglucomutase [archaeon]|jgi:phosphomannomutase|nr:phosphomannomutase/phosphoglucomutase [archaeon]MBT4350905.1 phosphomannomutase/phosphoglucomutase [archaeon]MBT4648331.1 phosphomannomutase/phosphoglucomutase [archaeon]MBT6822320.1 phosphomannomutase/phosphoglucomutase [archaeon]
MAIFKAYDIRGIYPDQLDEETVFRIGRAYCEILKEEIGHSPTIVVGRDMRLSSPQLSQKIMEGITIQGGNVIYIDLASTPTFYFATSVYEADGGMQISASHNPKEYNGVKIVKKNAFPVGYDTGINEIEKRVLKNEFIESDIKGNIEKREGILDKEVDFSLAFGDISKIKPLKVVADPANSMGSPFLKKLFDKLPCELIEMNFELDGTFPAHQADPFQEKNIIDLGKKIVETGADIGIATDGDGDRIFFLDNKGKLAEPAIIRGLTAKNVLKKHPGATICYDIRPGKITRDMILENGGKPIVTKVGHSLIKAKGIEVGAEYAGESSGHFFIKTKYGFFETPMIVALIILDELSTSGKSFSELLEPLRKYSHSGEINSKVENKEATMKKLSEIYSNAKDISWLDGITIEFDNWWFNVRPSNTEPLLRLNLEADTKELMEEKRDEILNIIRS